MNLAKLFTYSHHTHRFLIHVQCQYRDVSVKGLNHLDNHKQCTYMYMCTYKWIHSQNITELHNEQIKAKTRTLSENEVI